MSITRSQWIDNQTGFWEVTKFNAEQLHKEKKNVYVRFQVSNILNPTKTEETKVYLLNKHEGFKLAMMDIKMKSIFPQIIFYTYFLTDYKITPPKKGYEDSKFIKNDYVQQSLF